MGVTYLVVVDEVEPRHDMDPGTGVSALSAGNALHVLGELAVAVEWLAALDSADHVAHVHVNLAAILGEAIESVCSRCGLAPIFLQCFVPGLASPVWSPSTDRRHVGH